MNEQSKVQPADDAVEVVDGKQPKRARKAKRGGRRRAVSPAEVSGRATGVWGKVAVTRWVTGAPVGVVCGKPIGFGTRLGGPPSPRLHRAISERSLDAIRELGDEDKAIRARMR